MLHPRQKKGMMEKVSIQLRLEQSVQRNTRDPSESVNTDAGMFCIVMIKMMLYHNNLTRMSVSNNKSRAGKKTESIDNLIQAELQDVEYRQKAYSDLKSKKTKGMRCMKAYAKIAKLSHGYGSSKTSTAKDMSSMLKDIQQLHEEFEKEKGKALSKDIDRDVEGTANAEIRFLDSIEGRHGHASW